MTDHRMGTVQTVYAAFGRGDDIAPWHGVHRGKAEVPNFFTSLGEALDVTEFTQLSIRPTRRTG